VAGPTVEQAHGGVPEIGDTENTVAALVGQASAGDCIATERHTRMAVKV
jgi:hypothetical protein